MLTVASLFAFSRFIASNINNAIKTKNNNSGNKTKSQDSGVNPQSQNLFNIQVQIKIYKIFNKNRYPLLNVISVFKSPTLYSFAFFKLVNPITMVEKTEIAK